MRCVLMLACALLMVVAEAREIGGMSLAHKAVVGGETLRLNGGGVRSRLFVRVYVAGLYVVRPSPDIATVIGANAPGRMLMQFLRDVRQSQLADASRAGFSADTASSDYERLSSRIERLAVLMGDAGEGDEILVYYLPGGGTRVTVNGVERGIIDGRDFSDASFSVWLGAQPVSDDLEAALPGL